MKNNKKHYLTVSYVNSNGGVNNIQVAKISIVGEAFAYIKCFTSKINKAKQYADKFIRKNKIELV